MSSNPPPWLDAAPERAPARLAQTRKPDPIGSETRAIVRTRSGGACECCGGPNPTHFHHRQLRRGGQHGPSNVVLVDGCHQRIHGHVRWALDTGWIVSQYDDPAMREILYRGRDWVFLGANGELLDAAPTS